MVSDVIKAVQKNPDDTVTAQMAVLFPDYNYDRTKMNNDFFYLPPSHAG